MKHPIELTDDYRRGREDVLMELKEKEWADTETFLKDKIEQSNKIIEMARKDLAFAQVNLKLSPQHRRRHP